MQQFKSFELLPEQALLWKHFLKVNTEQRLPHAVLFVDPLKHIAVDFAYKMAAFLFCQHDSKPCQSCQSCYLLSTNNHPDFHYVGSEKLDEFIKVDQIRALQSVIFTSSQLTNQRIILINPAEKMNRAAANSLLKLLEEPPLGVLFILIADQINTLPATVLSRCQKWYFPAESLLNKDYLVFAKDYFYQRNKEDMYAQLTEILNDLIVLNKDKLSICNVAAKWSKCHLRDLLVLIYLINSQLIDYQLRGYDQENNVWSKTLIDLNSRIHLTRLFKQLDQINAIIKKLNQNVAINTTLVLEQLFLGYT